MNIDRAVLLVGSAKAPGTSTSEALAQYLGARLVDRGVAVEVDTVSRRRVCDPDGHLANAVSEADLFALVTPLYVDSLPYLVTRTLESLAAARRSAPQSRRGMFVAIVNCGFPEPQQCQTAIDIARVFARRAGFEWGGALALGEGAAIDGRRLEEAGGMTRHVRAALDLAATALAHGQPVPDEAMRRMARQLMPRFAYLAVANIGLRRHARRNRIDLGARPFDR